MSGEIEIHIQDENGKPVDLSNAYIYRDDSGVVMEDSDENRQCIVSPRELEERMSQTSIDDPPVYVVDLVNGRRWRIDIPRVTDARQAYLQGELDDAEFEQQVERALEHYGDPEGVYDS